MPEAGETESLRWYTRWKQVIKANMVRALQGFGDMRHLALSIATPPLDGILVHYKRKLSTQML